MMLCSFKATLDSDLLVKHPRAAAVGQMRPGAGPADSRPWLWCPCSAGLGGLQKARVTKL